MRALDVHAGPDRRLDRLMDLDVGADRLDEREFHLVIGRFDLLQGTLEPKIGAQMSPFRPGCADDPLRSRDDPRRGADGPTRCSMDRVQARHDPGRGDDEPSCRSLDPASREDGRILRSDDRAACAVAREGRARVRGPRAAQHCLGEESTRHRAPVRTLRASRRRRRTLDRVPRANDPRGCVEGGRVSSAETAATSERPRSRGPSPRPRQLALP
jgi:hypothetical protein